jgi:DNA repair exonuclease SbcCD ATPase subunit
MDRECTRLANERDRIQVQLGQVEVELQKQDLALTDARRKLAQAVAQAPEPWKPRVEKAGMKEWSDLKAELGQLEAAGTEERHRELLSARQTADDRARDLAALEAREGEFPADARVKPEAITAKLQAAQVEEGARDEGLLQAREKLAALQRRQGERDETQSLLTKAEGECEAIKLLARLLGREHLQLYLVRQAERQVVDNANGVLDRLSSGQLCLQLNGAVGSETPSDEALDLVVYNRATGERPINVSFLSGSQKFRVAVSLALGLGQYASRRHRPIESVIIDEGFGCLDHVGRQVMIQEMRNLGRHMKCILLVSHQAEFADAFDVGWQFELEDGTTRVKRIQR